jgi:glycosyltransferase 2 family protein
LSRRRRLFFLSAKVAIAALLVGWLVRSGTLDVGALRLFIDRPALLVGNFALYALGMAFGTLRWRLLLRLADVRLPFGRALQLQLTAVFFNVVVPGNIGGDVVKSIYVAREVTPAQRPTVFLIAFVDRLVAVAGLIVVALVATLARGRLVWDHPQLRELAGAVVVLAGLTFGAPLVLVVLLRSGERFRSSPGGTTRFARIFGQLVAATRLVLARPRTLLDALGLSIIVYVAGAVLFAAIAAAVTRQDVSLSAITSIYPLGMLTLVVPISPAGIGVGHVAFDHLFAIVGLGEGATVFNIYLVGQLAPCLLGALPYLALRRAATPPTEAEAATQQIGVARQDGVQNVPERP